MTKRHVWKLLAFLPVFLAVQILSDCGKKTGSSDKDPAGKSDAANPLEVVVEKRIIKGFSERNTPDDFNRVGYIRYSLKGQKNMDMPLLVLVSGYVADTAWFERMAVDLVMRKNIEVWSVNRRQSLVEDRDGLARDMDEFVKDAKSRDRLLKKMNTSANYILCSEEFTRHWGLDVQMEDVKAVVEEAKKFSKNIFMGGWSDGVEYVMMYSNYRFKTGFGSLDLKGMVFLDENPEWGTIQNDLRGNDRNIKQQEELMKGNHLYMKYYPSLVVHNLAIHMAWLKPGEKSPLAEVFRLPAEILSRGITNMALVGWLYDLDIDRYPARVRGDFAYLLRSGNFVASDLPPSEKMGKPVEWVSDLKGGDVTSLAGVIRAYSSKGTFWEYFYPRKVLLDYFLLGKCDFNCPEMNVFVNRENRLPVFYILTGTNNVGDSVPAGLQWFFGKSGITIDKVRFLRLYDYAHADIYFAGSAPAGIYRPLYDWMNDTGAGTRKELK